MEKIVLNCLQEITGVDEGEFKEYANIHLLDEGILDSLCLVTLIDMLSESTGSELSLNDFTRDDFDGIAALVEKVELLSGK